MRRPDQGAIQGWWPPRGAGAEPDALTCAGEAGQPGPPSRRFTKRGRPPPRRLRQRPLPTQTSLANVGPGRRARLRSRGKCGRHGLRHCPRRRGRPRNASTPRQEIPDRPHSTSPRGRRAGRTRARVDMGIRTSRPAIASARVRDRRLDDTPQPAFPSLVAMVVRSGQSPRPSSRVAEEPARRCVPGRVSRYEPFAVHTGGSGPSCDRDLESTKIRGPRAWFRR
jgi:hypothetical protein